MHPSRKAKRKAIFSYDGTNRIRFTGQGVYAHSQPVHRPPEEGTFYAVVHSVAQKKRIVKRQKLWGDDSNLTEAKLEVVKTPTNPGDNTVIFKLTKVEDNSPLANVV